MTTSIYLVRHGQSLANARNILQGKTIDEGLSPAGQQQAAAAGLALARQPIQAVYASGMLRARETAAAIASAHGLDVQSVAGLHEIDVGLWAGLNWTEVRARWPEDLERYQADPEHSRHTGGESYTDVLQRVQPVFQDLWERHAGESVAIVAHNVVNRVYLCHLLGLELRRSPALKQHNGCINILRRVDSVTSVITCNAVLHLHEW